MTWIAQNKRAWRAVLLALLVVAFLGPWNIGLSYVPDGVECSPPYTRLEANFCGWPQSGLRMGFQFARNLAFAVGAFLGGEASAAGAFLGEEASADRLPLILAIILVARVLAPFVPVALSLAALWRGSGRALRWLWPFWLLGMLAVIINLLFMAADGSEFGFPYLRHVWGAWLYVILAAAMVAGESRIRVKKVTSDE